jgi:hypothetical protein
MDLFRQEILRLPPKCIRCDTFTSHQQLLKDITKAFESLILIMNTQVQTLDCFTSLHALDFIN